MVQVCACRPPMSRKEALHYSWLPKVDIWIVWRMGWKTRYQAVAQRVEGTPAKRLCSFHRGYDVGLTLLYGAVKSNFFAVLLANSAATLGFSEAVAIGGLCRCNQMLAASRRIVQDLRSIWLGCSLAMPIPFLMYVTIRDPWSSFCLTGAHESSCPADWQRLVSTSRGCAVAWRLTKYKCRDSLFKCAQFSLNFFWASLLPSSVAACNLSSGRG